MSIAIQAENISKAYQIGEFSTGTLTKDIDRWWKLMRGKEDPYLKIGETNDRSTKGDSDVVWSLKDINFDIEQGNAVGIIGRNGAGKSTLLKILSRVTTPTTGSVKAKGRIASLLEVGTGFHPELTGRENIFLNGAILGMRKHEIKKHFDAIVDFSGVERYIDTPVKRYSSGMYVRLAFAVAAHLESEILIVDEVLAVGDAEFQQKCLGKMGEVSKGEGRTILFVSHNMSAIRTLCTKGILLSNGNITFEGNIDKCVNKYNSINFNFSNTWIGKAGDENVSLLETSINPAIGNDFINSVDLLITIKFEVHNTTSNLVIGFNLMNLYDECLAYCVCDDYNETPTEFYNVGIYEKKFKIPAYYLSKGSYKIVFDIGIHNIHRIIYEEGSLFFDIVVNSAMGMRFITSDVRGFASILRPNWELI